VYVFLDQQHRPVFDAVCPTHSNGHTQQSASSLRSDFFLKACDVNECVLLVRSKCAFGMHQAAEARPGRSCLSPVAQSEMPRQQSSSHQQSQTMLP
jgi:hypothetical protein